MPYGGTTPRKSGYVIPHLTGALPQKSCITDPHGGTPVAILQDGGLRIYSSSLTVGYVIPLRTAAAAPKLKISRGFCPQNSNSSGLLPPFFGGGNLHPLFLIFGPEELPQNGLKGPPYY